MQPESLMATHLFSALFLQVLLFATCRCDPQDKPELPNKPVALFIFGDSYLDAGNNNYLTTTTLDQANFWPYGETYFKFPTGRFSDGRLVSDFCYVLFRLYKHYSEYANLPVVPPFLQPGLDQYNLGVNFASGGAGALVETFEGDRLEFLSLTETETLSGLEDHIEIIKDILQEIGTSIEEGGCGECDAFLLDWVNELRRLINGMEYQLHEFILQKNQQNESESLALTNSFRGELDKIEFRLTELLHKLTARNNSTAIEEDIKDEGDKLAPSYGSESQQSKASSTTTEEEKGKKEEVTMWLDSTIHKEEEKEAEGNKGENCDLLQGETPASSISIGSKLINLPYYLHPFLMFCCIFPENHWIPKGKLMRLMVAEGLVLGQAGKILEDVAEEYINELISKGMLQEQNERPGRGTKFTVSPPYRMFFHQKCLAEPVNSDSTITLEACRIITSNMSKVSLQFNYLRPRSLFLFGNQDLLDEKWLDFTWAKFLRVLDLENKRIKRLPDEVVDLIFLTYLCLKNTDITELPLRLGRLKALQTLDIRWCGNLAMLSDEVVNLASLRHFKMFKNIGVSGMRLPEGIGRLTNLLTLTGIFAGGNTAAELSELSRIRRLGVMEVTGENLTELFESIMQMQDLLSLSLEANCPSNSQPLFILDSFSPPPLIRKLRLEGLLEKLPSWLGSMENLTKLRLGFSHLSENPMLVLQVLPSLKHLTLWQAYDARKMGKDFCRAGWFSKLEVLSIASRVLEEWTELEEGALPSLQYLHFHNCLNLRMLPEGLQFVTTLKQLDLLPLLDDHVERLQPDAGPENYKIRHIPVISFLPMSVLSSITRSGATPTTSTHSDTQVEV